MQCILYKIYFWKVFHKYYNLICIFICTPICTKFYSCKKWVLQVLGGRVIKRSGDTVCGLHRARGDEERKFLG
jgi:hypothetical protein